MLLVLHRIYFPEGTLGLLQNDGETICYTIELPWLNNKRMVSCIPEGKYILKKRYSNKFGWHIHLIDVPGRDFILIHPANNAKKELLGCIAPVSNCTGIGKGNYSRKALKKLTDLVFPKLDKTTEVQLLITST